MSLTLRKKLWEVVELVERPQPTATMSVAEAEKLLKAAGVISEWGYAKDDHFARYIFDDLKTEADVEAFLAKLDQDNTDQTEPGPFRWGCSKAKSVRSWLAKPFWRKSITNMKGALAPARRVTCSCHELGSYCRLDQVKK